VAVVVYFALIIPINFLKKRAFQKKESGIPAVAEDTPPTELELLAEIRDLLAKTPTEGKHTP
jgi:large conductance mechanosensitive channel